MWWLTESAAVSAILVVVSMVWSEWMADNSRPSTTHCIPHGMSSPLHPPSRPHSHLFSSLHSLLPSFPHPSPSRILHLLSLPFDLFPPEYSCTLQAAGAANVGVPLTSSDAAAIKAAEDRAAQLSPPSGPTSPTSASIGAGGARPRFLISGCTASSIVTPVTWSTAGGGGVASAGPPGMSLGDQAVRLSHSQAVHTLDEALQVRGFVPY